MPPTGTSERRAFGCSERGDAIDKKKPSGITIGGRTSSKRTSHERHSKARLTTYSIPRSAKDQQNSGVRVTSSPQVLTDGVVKVARHATPNKAQQHGSPEGDGRYGNQQDSCRAGGLSDMARTLPPGHCVCLTVLPSLDRHGFSRIRGERLAASRLVLGGPADVCQSSYVPLRGPQSDALSHRTDSVTFRRPVPSSFIT